MGMSPACEAGLHRDCEGIHRPVGATEFESCTCQHHSLARAAAAIADRNAAPRLVPMMVVLHVDPEQRAHVVGPFDDRDQAEVWVSRANVEKPMVLPLADPHPLPDGRS